MVLHVSGTNAFGNFFNNFLKACTNYLLLCSAKNDKYMYVSLLILYALMRNKL